MKIFVAVNVDQENSFMNVTDEHVHGDKVLLRLYIGVEKSDKKITMGKLFAEYGSFDGNEIFECIGDKIILPCNKVIANARTDRIKNPSLETFQFWS